MKNKKNCHLRTSRHLNSEESRIWKDRARREPRGPDAREARQVTLLRDKMSDGLVTFRARVKFAIL